MILFYYLYQLYWNGEYRECEHRTYIVKEQYDRLKSSASLSTLKTLIIFFPNMVLAWDGLRGYGGDHDARLLVLVGLGLGVGEGLGLGKVPRERYKT